MNNVIKDNIKRKCDAESKKKALLSLKEDIEIAEKILSGEMIYCEDCEDYYFAKSFFTIQERKNEWVCSYYDPINSGGNEYEMQIVINHYRICPKGHKHLIGKS